MAETNVFVSVPQHVKARRLFADQWETISGKRLLCPAGTWLVEAVNGAGDQLCMPDDIFRLQFRPTDTASESAWKETTNAIYPHWPDGKPILLS